ncbi:MAG: heparin lyase I family protein, partial [Cyanobacteria bacterium P01_F01_bin.3]
GDWELEYATGDIETASPFSPKLLQTYKSVLGNYKYEGTSYRLHSKTKHGVNTAKNPSGGGDAMRIELRYGDPFVSNKRRAEVIPSGSTKYGTTYTYELSKFIPNSWKADSQFEILMQWHQRPDGGESWGNPPMVLDASGNQIRLRTTIEKGSGKVKKTLWSAPLKKGSWIDYKFEINWSKNSNGYVKAWQNGKQVVNYKGQTANNDKSAPFLKYGIYKHNWGNKSIERVLYFKDFNLSKGATKGNARSAPVKAQSLEYKEEASYEGLKPWQIRKQNEKNGSGSQRNNDNDSSGLKPWQIRKQNEKNGSGNQKNNKNDSSDLKPWQIRKQNEKNGSGNQKNNKNDSSDLKPWQIRKQNEKNSSSNLKPWQIRKQNEKSGSKR